MRGWCDQRMLRIIQPHAVVYHSLSSAGRHTGEAATSMAGGIRFQCRLLLHVSVLSV